MPDRFRVNSSTTLGELGSWVDSHAYVQSVRVKKTTADPGQSSQGYRAIAELAGVPLAIVSDPKSSIPESLDSLVSEVESEFPSPS